MAFQETFLEIYILILCINGGIMMIDAFDDTTMITPFDINRNVTATTMPDIYQYNATTNTASGNLYTNATSYSGAITDPLFYPYAIMQSAINLITGGFIWQTLAIFGLPAIFVSVFQTIIGVLLIRSLIYYVTGR
jgi:hypothetical protein